jgi:hypothetical protein
LHSARNLPVGQWEIGTPPNPRLIQKARLKKEYFPLKIRFFPIGRLPSHLLANLCLFLSSKPLAEFFKELSNASEAAG